MERGAGPLSPSDSMPVKVDLAAWDPESAAEKPLHLPDAIVEKTVPQTVLPRELLALADSIYALSVLVARSRKARTSTDQPPGRESVDGSSLGKVDAGTAPAENSEVDVDAS